MHVSWLFFSGPMAPRMPCSKSWTNKKTQTVQAVKSLCRTTNETEIQLGQRYGVNFSREAQVSLDGSLMVHLSSSG